MQVLQHVGVSGSIVEDHQDMEGESLRREILLQLVHQGSLAVRLKNMSTAVSMDRQVGFIIALECTKVFGVVHHHRLELAVSCQVSPQQEGETVLESFEAPGRLLVLRSGIFFHCRPISSILKNYWGL